MIALVPLFFKRMKVYVWLPAEGNTYGHVALETDRYYMSFWPRGNIKADGEGLKAAGEGVDADIVYHRDLDFHLEGKRKPGVIDLPYKVKDSAINNVLERFLRDNGVDPEDVTLEAAERKIQDFLRTGSDEDWPVKELSKTRYTYLVHDGEVHSPPTCSAAAPKPVAQLCGSRRAARLSC